MFIDLNTPGEKHVESVRVNGEIVQCTAADDVEGWADVFMGTKFGHPIIHRVHGAVTIVYDHGYVSTVLLDGTVAVVPVRAGLVYGAKP